MTDFPTGFTDATKPLPADQLDDRAAEAAGQLAGKGYEIHTGLTKEFAQAISKMALEPGIREYCPKDSGKRFKNLKSTEQWLTKRRVVFLLLKRQPDGSLKLAGYGWAGPATDERIPDGQTTFALRIGEIGQGKGLATPFCWLVVAAAAALYGARNFWLETWGSNGAAVHVYRKLGFETVDEVTGERPTANGSLVKDVRIFMRLPENLLSGTFQ